MREWQAAAISHAFAVKEGFGSVVAVPLHAPSRLVGVMTCFMRGPRHFTPRELEFHTTVGQLFAVAIEKARLFQELREALRLREEFMSAAAHELRTPVTTIQTWAELLSRTETAPRGSTRAWPPSRATPGGSAGWWSTCSPPCGWPRACPGWIATGWTCAPW